tara:strand:+ start:2537 stop:2977 length:441 start_codon:yes stop_codon:yes gene_type:complete
VTQLIKKTGAVYVSVDGEATGSSYPERIFCILETSAAIDGGATLMIQTPYSGPLKPPIYAAMACCICECWWNPIPDYRIDAKAAQARRAEDKAAVDTFIENGAGFARVNQMMERELTRTAKRWAWANAIDSWCGPCQAMGCMQHLA